MARIVIAFESANGFTRKCAERLAGEFGRAEVLLCDLEYEEPTFSSGDVFLVGCPVRRGKLMKKTAVFLKQLAEKSGEYSVGVFLCCGFADRFEEYRDRLLPKALLQSAFCILNFGGTLDPAGKPFWDKLWLFRARSQVVESEIEDGEYTPVLPGMIPENIGQMATFAKKELLRTARTENGQNAQ